MKKLLLSLIIQNSGLSEKKIKNNETISFHDVNEWGTKDHLSRAHTNNYYVETIKNNRDLDKVGQRRIIPPFKNEFKIAFSLLWNKN